ncbi:MAG: hypothetical protein BWZ04_02918 [Firmicutes bacterium ADurb.BinA205]|nr:MAG: hypothetical protein BWZ04_02918 [Firmicutes bacterium ADurb.BinA205]
MRAVVITLKHSFYSTYPENLTQIFYCILNFGGKCVIGALHLIKKILQ